MRHLDELGSSAAGALTELIALGVATAYYPLGLTSRIRQQPHPRADEATDARSLPTSAMSPHYPVLLAHGIWHNQSWSVRLERTLTRQGYLCQSINYRTVGCGIEDAAAQVAAHVRELAERTRSPRVHVVGHSLGGIVLRAAVTHHHLDPLIGAAVTIGSPHRGTPLATPVPALLPVIGPLVGPMVDQLRPRSAFLRRLDADTRPGTAHWTAVYSNLDEIVPGRSGRLDHPALRAHNVELAGLGHLALMFVPQVASAVASALSEAERAQGDGEVPGGVLGGAGAGLTKPA